MSKVLIAGIGSPFGADQLGWQVVDRLHKDDLLRAYLPHQVQLIKLDRPGSSLIETMQGYEAVILVDAVQSNLMRGQSVYVKGEQIIETANGLSSHGFGVAETIALARAMQQLPKELILMGLEVGVTPDTPFTQEQVNQLANRVCLTFTEILMREGMAS